jgi:hypothetical protein
VFGGGCWIAASKVVVRSGRHFAQFTLSSGSHMFVGVIRSGCGVEGGSGAYSVDGHCFYWTYSGSRHPGPNHNWKGMQDAREQGDRIGMLLDLDQGSMSIWKNGERLGVMQAEGLTGPLCWAAVLAGQGDSARIESAPIPVAALAAGAS